MNPAVEAGLFGVLLPTVVCGLLMLGQVLVPHKWHMAWSSLAMALGYAAGHFALSGAGSIRPRESINWLPYFGIIASVVALVVAIMGNTRVVQILGSAAVCLYAILFFGKFDAEQRIIYSAGFFIAGLCTFAGLDAASRNAGKLSTTLAMLVLFIMLSVTLGMSGSAKLAQLMGAATSCIGAIFVVMAIMKMIRADAGVPVFTAFALLLAAILYGHVFSSLSLACAALLAVAALALLVARIPAVVRMATSRKAMHRAIGFLLPATAVAITGACAAFLAFKQSPPMEYY